MQLDPNSAELHSNLGAFLSNLGQADEAVVHCRRALELKPQHVDAYYNLSRALVDQGQLDEAEACCRRALELRPDVLQAHHNLAFVLEKQHRLADAAACLERVFEANPHDVEGHLMHAQLLLEMGRFAEGWPEYEWRLQRPGEQENFPVPRWNGDPLAGRTILLRSEQGFGDDLQFIRYAELVRRQGGTVIVGCRPPMARLLATCSGVDRVVVVGESLPPLDVHAPLPSLPGILGTTLENIPVRVPYLSVDPALTAEWARELGDRRTFKVGIAWQGSLSNPADRLRSFKLDNFAGLARLPRLELVSLQMGAGREQLAERDGQWPILDLGDRLGDFYNTAAILSNLDLVITCDSAPAHLAGALGLPVWVALQFAPDWRWMLDRTDSPWYPTMRLFRQPAPGDWSAVFRDIAAALAAMLAAR